MTLSDNQDALVQELKNDILSVGDVVATAIEGGDRRTQYEAALLIPPLIERYNALLLQSTDDEKQAIERVVGRMLTDLRRQAAVLARLDSGRRAERAADAGQPFLLSRPQAPAPNRPGGNTARTLPLHLVGGEIEAWCGKCKDLRSHRIIALLAGLPKQVVCASCNSRHGFRSGPAKPNKGSGLPGAGTSSSSLGPTKEKKGNRERDRLEHELLSALSVPPFDPRGDFKQGQIIAHPKWGRGKVETVLRGSLLVRFLDGLRQVSRQ